MYPILFWVHEKFMSNCHEIRMFAFHTIHSQGMRQCLILISQNLSDKGMLIQEHLPRSHYGCGYFLNYKAVQ